MKRLLLRIEYKRGRSVQTRTLALPSIWTIRDLHESILLCFPAWETDHAFRFRAPDGSKFVSGTPLDDEGDGMRASDRLWRHFSKGGDVLEYIYGDFAEMRDATVSFAGTDEGDGPACLQAEGPKSGPNKPDIDEITEMLRDEDDEEADGENGGILFSGNIDDIERLPPAKRKAIKEILLRSSAARLAGEIRPELEWIAPNASPCQENSPEIIALDDTPVDPSLRKTAYALARRIWDLAPWNSLQERDAIAIRLADGRERILSVLGARGEYFALSFYPDFATFNAFQQIASEHMPFGAEHFYAFWQWQLAFLKTSELLPVEAAAVKESGIAFARGRLPSFESFAPGFVAHPAGGRELADLVELLTAAAILFSDSAAMGRIRTLDSGLDPVNVWSRNDQGAWKLSSAPRDSALRFPFDLPAPLLAELRALPVRDCVISFGEILTPIGRLGERRRIARCILAVEERTHFTLPPQFDHSDEKKPRLFQPADFLAALAKSVIRSHLGFFPKRLASPSVFLEFFLRRLAELRGGGARFDPAEPCYALLDVHRFMSDTLHR